MWPDDETLPPDQPSQSLAGNTEAAIFSVHDLCFAYGKERLILDGVNFSLCPGENIGLWGSNGSGKTTFFRCVTGLVHPQNGSIRLGGKLIASENDFHELRRKVGYALQNAEDQLFFPAVLEDLAFGPLNLGLSPEEANRRALESMSLVGLEGFEKKLTHRLSGGEKKLIALAAILAMRPKALLLDEPLNELDEASSARLENVVCNLDCAKIIIAHDRDFLRRTCGKIIHLANGKFRAWRM